jgi:hypothetical protein
MALIIIAYNKTDALPGRRWPDVVVAARERVPGEVLVVQHGGLVAVRDPGTVRQVIPEKSEKNINIKTITSLYGELYH